MTSPAMLFIVPSRSRPQNVARLLEAWRETHATAHLWVVVDNDDPRRAEYLEIDLLPNTLVICDERRRLGPTLNVYATEASNRFDVIGFMGDDHVPITPAWDALLWKANEAVEGGVVYGNDKFQGPNLPTAVAIDARIIQTLGFMVPPGMIHVYLDNFWKDLGTAIGRLVYLPNVIIEHMHPAAGKADLDPLYGETGSPGLWEADKRTYDAYLEKRMKSDVRRIKTMLRSEVA